MFSLSILFNYLFHSTFELTRYYGKSVACPFWIKAVNVEAFDCIKLIIYISAMINRTCLPFLLTSFNFQVSIKSCLWMCNAVFEFKKWLDKLVAKMYHWCMEINSWNFINSTKCLLTNRHMQLVQVLGFMLGDIQVFLVLFLFYSHFVTAACRNGDIWCNEVVQGRCFNCFPGACCINGCISPCFWFERKEVLHA